MLALPMISEETRDFVWYERKYVNDKRACVTLNRVLGTQYLAVFRREDCYARQWAGDHIKWDGETFFALSVRNRLIRFGNSEWATFEVVRK